MQGLIWEVGLKVHTLGHLASWVKLTEPLGSLPNHLVLPLIQCLIVIFGLLLSARNLSL